MNVYEKSPVLENENFLLRFVEENDAQDLLSGCRFIPMKRRILFQTFSG